MALSDPQTKDLRQCFDWLDSSGDGEIAAPELLVALKATSAGATLQQAEDLIREGAAPGKATLNWLEFLGVFEKALAASKTHSSAAQSASRPRPSMIAGAPSSVACRTNARLTSPSFIRFPARGVQCMSFWRLRGRGNLGRTCASAPAPRASASLVWRTLDPTLDESAQMTCRDPLLHGRSALRAALLAHHCDASDHTIDKMIRYIDADGDGQVSLQEVSTYS